MKAPVLFQIIPSVLLIAVFSVCCPDNVDAEKAAAKSADAALHSSYAIEEKKTKKNKKNPRVRSLAVNSLTLVNIKKKKVLKGYRRLKDGAVISLSKLRKKGVAVRANTTPKKLRNILFEITPKANIALEVKTSGLSLLARKGVGKVKKLIAEEGEYTITATPFNSKKGKRGKAHSVNVTVVDDVSPDPTPEASPTSLPSADPTAEPTVEPTILPTVEPTAEPTPDPEIKDPTPAPTPMPTPNPITGQSAWTVHNAMVHRDGEAIFPLGMYYVSHYSNQKQQRLQDVVKIGAAGFNMIHTPVDRYDEEFMDLCADSGVHVAIEFNDSASYLLDKFGEHPALALLGTFDDVDAMDDGQLRYTPQEVLTESAALKALAPNTLTYISAGYPTRAPNFVDTSDSMGFQVYPVPAEPLSAVTAGYFGPMEPVMAGHNQAFIANLQSFGWYGTYRMPTNREVRNMTYQALLTGVKGVFYYTYFDAAMDMNDHPDLWVELGNIVLEIKDLEAVLLHGDRQSLSTGDSQVYAAQWQHSGKLIVAVVNARSVSRQVLVGLNGSITGPAVNKFPNRESGLVRNGGVLQGTIGAEAVHVYEIDLL
jgi:hypothetical protein